MDGNNVSENVHREGTFDTDPTQTLVDSTGAVKRGSIELPNIGGTTRIKTIKSKQSQLSIDSLNVDDVSQFLKTLKSTAKISKLKSQSFKSTATNDVQKYSKISKHLEHSQTKSQPSTVNALSKIIPDTLSGKSDCLRNEEFLGYSRLKPSHRNNSLSSSLTQDIKTSRSNSFQVPKKVDQLDILNVISPDSVTVDYLASGTSLITPTIQTPMIRQEPPTDTKMSQHSQTSEGGVRVIETYESVYAERKKLLENEVAYRKRIKQLEDELYSLLKTTEDTRAKNKVLRTKLDSIENENRKMKGDNHMQTLLGKGTLSARSDTDKIEMESQIEKLKDQNKKLEEESMNIMHATPKEELSPLELENGEMRTKIIQLSQKINDREVENEKTKDEFGRERDLLEKEVNKLNEKLNSEAEKTDGEKVVLEEEIVKLQTENQRLNIELAELKDQLEKSNKLIMEQEKERITLQSSMTAVESEKLTELQYLKNECAKIESKSESLKSAKHDLESQRDNLLSDNKEIQTKLSDLEISYRDIAESVAQKNTDKDRLVNALGDNNRAKNELQIERQEREKLQNQCDKLKENVETTSNELEEIKIEKDKLESEKMELEKESEIYKKSCEIKSTYLGKMEAELKETKQKLQKEMDKQNNLLKGAEEMTNEVLGKNKELQKLQEKAAKRKNEKNKAIAELKTSNEEKESLKQEMEFITNKAEKLKKHEQLISSDLGDQLKNMKKALSDCKNDNVKLSTEMDMKKAECEDLTKQLRELNIRMETINTKIKEVESERKEWLVQKEKYSEVESNYEKILEENKYLRTLSGMEGWVAGLFDDKDVRKAEYVGSINTSKVSRPKKKDRLVLKPVDRTNKASENIGDLHPEEDTLSQKSTASLPSIDALANSRLSYSIGYRQIYKNRMKSIAKYKRT